MKRHALSSPQSLPKRRALAALAYRATALALWIACGQCATLFGLVATAIKLFDHAVAHDDTDLDALCGLAHLLRLNDILANETVGSQRAIDRLQRALERLPPLLKLPRLFKELAECYLLIGLNEQAHLAIQTAIQLQDNDPLLWLLSAQTLIRVGARQPAGAALNHCLSLLPKLMRDFNEADVETARAAHAELAAIAAADGNIELLIAELTATLALPAPPLVRLDEHIALWCALCTAKERANDIPGAIAACEQAQQAVGNSLRIVMNHAYLLLLDGQVDKQRATKAISLLSNIVNLDKERDALGFDGTQLSAQSPNPAATGAGGQGASNQGADFLPWYLLGRAYLVLEEPRLAYDCYQVALRSALNSPITWLAVGKLYLELKQLPDALAAYSQALRLQMEEGSPGTATAWDGLLCVYERCDGQLGDAADACQRLAACYRAMGDVKLAQFFDERAAQLQKAAANQAPVPELREPPNVPEFLLRDLVALLPSERIAFIQGGDAANANAGANGAAARAPMTPSALIQAPPPAPATATATPSATTTTPSIRALTNGPVPTTAPQVPAPAPSAGPPNPALAPRPAAASAAATPSAPSAAPVPLASTNGPGAPQYPLPLPAWLPQHQYRQQYTATPQQGTPQQSPPALHHGHPQGAPQPQMAPAPPGPPHLAPAPAPPGHPQPLPGQPYYFPGAPPQQYPPPPPNGLYPPPYYGSYVPVQYPVNNWR